LSGSSIEFTSSADK